MFRILTRRKKKRRLFRTPQPKGKGRHLREPWKPGSNCDVREGGKKKEMQEGGAKDDIEEKEKEQDLSQPQQKGKSLVARDCEKVALRGEKRSHRRDGSKKGEPGEARSGNGNGSSLKGECLKSAKIGVASRVRKKKKKEKRGIGQGTEVKKGVLYSQKKGRDFSTSYTQASPRGYPVSREASGTTRERRGDRRGWMFVRRGVD